MTRAFQDESRALISDNPIFGFSRQFNPSLERRVARAAAGPTLKALGHRQICMMRQMFFLTAEAVEKPFENARHEIPCPLDGIGHHRHEWNW